MGFSGGGSNILKPHTHDGSIAQDGGALNMDGITQGSLTAGDVVYSDGSNLQRLPIGAASDELRVNAGATAPEWYTPAGGSSPYVLVDSTTLGAAASEINTSFSSISCDDISELMCVFVGGLTSSSYVQMQINGITSNYYTFGVHSNNGISPNIVINTGSTSAWTLCSNNAGGGTAGGTSTFHIRGGTSTADPTSSSNASYSGYGSDMPPNACWFLGGSQNSTVNSFDRVRVFANSGNLTTGSKLTIYRINST